MSIILEYVVEILFMLISTLFVYLYKKIKKIIQTVESNRNSMLVLTKNLFIQKYYYYKRANYICICEKEALKNLYFEYKSLGGNGIVETIINEIDKLPIIKVDDDIDLTS